MTDRVFVTIVNDDMIFTIHQTLAEAVDLANKYEPRLDVRSMLWGSSAQSEILNPPE